MTRKINTFCLQSPQRKKMILQAVCFSFYTLILFSLFNKKTRFGTKTERCTTNESCRQTANSIAFAIDMAARNMPWKSVCRHQALQAMMLCNYYKIPCCVFVGFKKDEEKNEILAHAWAMAGGRIITGFCNPEEYLVQSIYKNKWA